MRGWRKTSPPGVSKLRWVPPKEEYPSLDPKEDSKEELVEDPEPIIRSSTPFDDLPPDMILEIFGHLGPSDLLSLRFVSDSIRKLVNKHKGDIFWYLYQLVELQKTRPLHFRRFWVNDVRKICGIRKLEELEQFPRLNYIVFHKMFPSNKSKKTRSLREGLMPQYVIHLDFKNSRFNHPIEARALPPKLEVLLFGNRYNQSIDGLFVRLNYLRVIRFGNNFNWGIPSASGAPVHTNPITIDPYTFPPSLEELIINSIHFDQDITGILKNLPNLKRLVFGPGYKQPIPYIPHSLEELIVGDYYSWDLMPVISSNNLKYLKVGKEYLHYIDPQSVPKWMRLEVDKESYEKVILNHYKQQIKLVSTS